jgi:hypothetical protein
MHSFLLIEKKDILDTVPKGSEIFASISYLYQERPWFLGIIFILVFGNTFIVGLTGNQIWRVARGLTLNSVVEGRTREEGMDLGEMGGLFGEQHMGYPTQKTLSVGALKNLYYFFVYGPPKLSNALVKK